MQRWWDHSHSQSSLLLYLEIWRWCLACRPSNRQIHKRGWRIDSGASDEWRGSAERRAEEELWGEHDSEFAPVKLLRRKGGEHEEGKNEPASLLWRVFIQRPLVSYQLKGLGDCFNTTLLASLPPLLNLSSIFFPFSAVFYPFAVFNHLNILQNTLARVLTPEFPRLILDLYVTSFFI